ncbi:MAG: hypothetical protein ACTSQY_00365 [Candidatus Odinarchaeia archaeon]|nr:MAG: hypothetical protein [Lokiarchaeota virus Fenrir Meg22_1012]URC17254.1 MAG: hypothetical protein [Lokiarchaeota virus Fenrir Meg22_1214]
MDKIDENLKEKLRKIADDNDVDFQDVLLLFYALREKIVDLEPNLSDFKINIRTYNGLLNYYSNKKFNRGKEFIIIPFGIFQEPLDTNEKMRNEIIKEFSNPQNRLKMILGESGDGSDSKVMLMKIKDAVIDNKNVFFNDVYKPVRSINKMTMLNNGEWVVVDGELWEPGDTPVARDYRKTIQYTEDGEVYKNRNWSRPLVPNWKMSIFGIGFFTGVKEIKNDDGTITKKQKNPIEDALITRVTLYGDQANPSSPKFICKKGIWFKGCKIKAVETKYSNDLFLQVNMSGESIDVSESKIKITDIIRAINKRIRAKALAIVEHYNSLSEDDKTKKIKELYNLYKKYTELDYIPIIDLADINDYHMKYRALKDEDGEIIKDDGGVWDKIDFNSFAICECAFSGVYSREGSSPKLILTDYSLESNQNVFAKYSNGLDVDLPSSTVYISLTTSRGNRSYDEDTKQFIVDPENAVAIPKIKGIGVIMDFTKLDIDQLIGDL